MENKKLLKFLLKDITEIEELLVEKGRSGFDAFEIEFIQSRFKGAKQIVKILEEKAEEKSLSEQAQELSETIHLEESEPESTSTVHEMNEPEMTEKIQVETKETLSAVQPEAIKTEENPIETLAESVVEGEEIQSAEKEEKYEKQTISNEVELDEEQDKSISKTLGDSFLKEKSVNDLMGNGAGKLDNKLSNSPVTSIQGAIGINDRYQYIRELFNGSADTFTATVSELDQFKSINEAVSYLQQNYKWKKTETSLKFVNLVKRRFSNG